MPPFLVQALTVEPQRQESDSCGMISNQSSSIFPKERDQMTDLVAVLEQLKKERAQLDRAITALSPVVGIKSGKLSGTGSRRRKISVAARKRIAAAQRARWQRSGEESGIESVDHWTRGTPVQAPFSLSEHLGLP